MDPCRIRSYLQVACAGLGFEIGEIWWTSNEHGSSTVAAIEEKPAEDGALVPAGSNGKRETKLRFVQLYTSKSYANRRSMLVTPPEDDEEEDYSDNNNMAHHHHHDHECTKDDLEKHKLSPRLVDAISKTAQVVWANTVKQEGLTGRSDIPLHTAVGMPVALDADGNMCVVVMFSPNNIQSTDEAMEYLQSISRSATSSSIPCLMPAFDRTEDIQHVPTSNQRSRAIQGHIMPQETNLGEGVTARFVSIDDNNSGHSTPDQRGPELATAPKDCFGIPMLPSFAELGNETAAHPVNSEAAPSLEDVFDEASYGVWSTIMQERPALVPSPAQPRPEDEDTDMAVENGIPTGLNEGINPAYDDHIDPKSLVTTHKRTMDRMRKDRLEEFCSAFLGMSVFDIADVWIPAGPEHPDCLSHVMSISSSNQSNAVSEFKRVSGYTLVKFWSGAVGRAYSSGNPVWSCNPDVYIDKGRAHVFERANIMTAFAVPIVSGKNATPVGVVCCYSMIQSGSVPFVLKFVQQAIHLLWSGLDKVEPHESVGHQMWQDVRPADLGEMAADVEMQHHFVNKKRPRATYEQPPAAPDQSAPLANQLKKIDFHRDEPAHYATDISHDHEPEHIPEFYNFQPMHAQHEKPPEQRVSVQAIQAFQNHIKEAVRQVGEALPFTHSHHIATTDDGRKRAHVVSHDSHGHGHGHGQMSTDIHHQPAPVPRPPRAPAPLSMPHALPTRVVKNPNHVHHSTVTIHELSPKLMDAPSAKPVVRQSQAPPTPPPVSYTHPPAAQNQNQPPLYQGDHMQPLPVHEQAQQPPTYAPSRLSQNLLSQGMLESIANQQYNIPQHEPAPAHHGQPPNTTMHYTPTPVAPTSVGAGPPLATNMQPPPVQTDDVYCMPAGSDEYPTPDMAKSDQGFAPAMNGKVKLCRIQGCDDPAVIRRPYCARHSGNRLCEHEGCTKCAQGSTRFCIAHGGGRRCTFPGCDKGARDKFFCAAHGGGKRCKADGCNKSAVGGSSLCTAHGGGRRCAVDGCDKSAQSSTKFCVKHGGGKKCCHEGCEKVARGRTQYCAAHGGGVRCKLDGCNRVAIGKMQLCRAHGGGSRARSKAHTTESHAPLPPPMATGPPMYAGNGMNGMQQMEYPTPTSV